MSRWLMALGGLAAACCFATQSTAGEPVHVICMVAEGPVLTECELRYRDQVPEAEVDRHIRSALAVDASAYADLRPGDRLLVKIGPPPIFETTLRDEVSGEQLRGVFTPLLAK